MSPQSLLNAPIPPSFTTTTTTTTPPESLPTTHLFTPSLPLPPSSLFHPTRTPSNLNIRFTSLTSPTAILAFIAGHCHSNGNPTALAGSSAVINPLAWGPAFKWPVPVDGFPHTDERAELYAAIRVLEGGAFRAEGYQRVVLATGSEYLVNGVSRWVEKWQGNGWKTSGGRDVANRDLWELLLLRLKVAEEKGICVQFWHIPREWNEAEAFAKEAAGVPVGDRETRVERGVVGGGKPCLVRINRDARMSPRRGSGWNGGKSMAMMGVDGAYRGDGVEGRMGICV
ncbi:ribonuclease H-like protein [Ascobolus immersus RN42]|uniref:ribonuclease H n=1 Tax=Ascobolus immersus RN42 TaxID=1160509 RepID=A0A3N4HKY3_ASCIM|nr:ribonuclease H-like protein [Ascobolus immersus RN42]